MILLVVLLDRGGQSLGRGGGEGGLAAANMGPQTGDPSTEWRGSLAGVGKAGLVV